MVDRNYITVVTGVPRSGTSMMMQMLNAGGLPALTDDRRTPDVHNPLGYFEYERVKSLPRDTSWMPLARSKAVKVIYRLLPYLPAEFEYRVIFMERELRDVLASQQEMLRTRADAAADQDLGRMLRALQAEIAEARAWLAAQSHIRMLFAPYEDVIAHPERWADNLSRFLDGLHVAAMTRVVNPHLRHHG